MITTPYPLGQILAIIVLLLAVVFGALHYLPTVEALLIGMLAASRLL